MGFGTVFYIYGFYSNHLELGTTTIYYCLIQDYWYFCFAGIIQDGFIRQRYLIYFCLLYCLLLINKAHFFNCAAYDCGLFY
jgi:hypothetical protein